MICLVDCWVNNDEQQCQISGISWSRSRFLTNLYIHRLEIIKWGGDPKLCIANQIPQVPVGQFESPCEQTIVKPPNSLPTVTCQDLLAETAATERGHGSEFAREWIMIGHYFNQLPRGSQLFLGQAEVLILCHHHWDGSWLGRLQGESVENKGPCLPVLCGLETASRLLISSWSVMNGDRMAWS